jgi:cytochrome c oxidase cbb3-type subunit III
MSDQSNEPKYTIDPLTGDKVLDTNYDGIQELDNPLPGWWVATFYGTIIFSILYVGYYMLGNGPSLYEEYIADYGANAVAQSKVSGPQFTEDSIAKAYQSLEQKEKAHAAYTEKCASCHGPEMQGLIGPNLVDNYWIHGDGKPPAIAKVLYDGVLEKGMPAWGALIPEETLFGIAAYIHEKNGSKPSNPKEPQGKAI